MERARDVWSTGLRSETVLATQLYVRFGYDHQQCGSGIPIRCVKERRGKMRFGPYQHSPWRHERAAPHGTAEDGGRFEQLICSV